MNKAEPLKGVRVGWDLDGVFYDIVGALRDYLVADRGFSRERLVEPTTYNFAHEWGMSEEAFWSHHDRAVCQNGLYAKWTYAIGEPAAAMDIVTSHGGVNYIVTARDPILLGVKHQTKQWLYNEIMPCEASIRFNPKKHEVEMDFFLDDNPEVCYNLIKAGCEAVLYDQPWNRDAVSIPRVHSHLEYLTYIMGKVNN